MRIISRSALHQFTRHYPIAATSLNDWFAKTEKADWNSFHELKNTFNSCDQIGNDRYVFDIGGKQI